MTMFRAPDFTGAATMTFFTPAVKYGVQRLGRPELAAALQHDVDLSVDHGTSPASRIR